MCFEKTVASFEFGYDGDIWFPDTQLPDTRLRDYMFARH